MSEALDKAESHQHTIDSLEPAVFFAQAEDILAEYTSVVTDDVIPRLTEWQGVARRHPLGFAVVPLKVLEDGSSLRLHVWPKDLRLGHSLKKPTIHDHGWHLISRVLTPDPYQDIRYNAQRVSDMPRTEEERITRGLQRVFRAHYPPEPQELRTDGTCARVTPIEDKGGIVLPGQYNRIVAGEYHLDTIPFDQTVATLCLDSPKLLADGPHVIIDGPADTIEMSRRLIDLEDLQYIQHALQKALA
jgi:hypothetical protein